MTQAGAADDVTVEPAAPEDLAACYALRHVVFVAEQGVPEPLERDEHDATATHWVARRHGDVIGTARARAVDATAKAERVAVLASARGEGIGRALMEAIEQWASARALDPVCLNAQIDAVPFYRSLGYAIDGAPFEEAGIMHRAMSKQTR